MWTAEGYRLENKVCKRITKKSNFNLKTLKLSISRLFELYSFYIQQKHFSCRIQIDKEKLWVVTNKI